ncbi:MAG: TRAP transporter TatT component family protein [Myxococcota bacterium]
MRVAVNSLKVPGIFAALVLVAAVCTGCGSMVRSATRPMIENLSSSIMKQRDVELVRQGAPAYLLLIDGLAEGSPRDAGTLASAARLYSAYNSAFVMDGDDPERAKILSEKAKGYAIAAMSLRNGTFARLHDKPFEQFQEVLPTLKKGDEDAVFLVISTWASYIQAHRDKWDNVADVAKIEALTRRLLELDETYYYGSGHLVMGVLCTLLPAALGGRPDEAKKHFDRALEISGGRFLQAYVLYADSYALAVFDRELYEKLLKTAMQAPDDVIPDIVLISVLAKKQAARKLAGADKLF